MSNYRLDRAAADDLVAIYVAGVDWFGLTQADRYHDGLTATFAFLAEYPRAARERKEISPPVRAFRYKAHLIVYELDESSTSWMKKMSSRSCASGTVARIGCQTPDRRRYAPTSSTIFPTWSPASIRACAAAASPSG